MMKWPVPGASEGRRITCRDPERLVKALTELPESTEMEDGSGSGVYRDLLFGLELSSMGTVGGFKSKLPQSTGKGF